MSTSGPGWDDVEALAEPTRRRVYEAVRAGDGPVTRDQVAAATGLSVQGAAFHLDRLAETGLLTVDFARPPGRSGPGAGRPAKRYAPSGRAVQVSVPPRRPNVVARVLAAAIATSPTDAAEAALEVARAEGQRVGEQRRGARKVSARTAVDHVSGCLDDLGYEPVRAGGRLRLRNCPFHDVVDVAPSLVCGLNYAMLTGVLTGLGAERVCEARGDGETPDCCVSVALRNAERRPGDG